MSLVVALWGAAVVGFLVMAVFRLSQILLMLEEVIDARNAFVSEIVRQGRAQAQVSGHNPTVARQHKQETKVGICWISQCTVTIGQEWLPSYTISVAGSRQPS